MDMISKLPSGILETILCLLPIQEAARTSILSKEWKYHWIRIPKLAFIEDTFQVSSDGTELPILDLQVHLESHRKRMAKRFKIFYAIYQVLIMHEGPIHEFTLCIDAEKATVEIDHIIFLLSRKNTVKKLTLDNIGEYTLPLSVYSLCHLTDLCLVGCNFKHEPTFNGFGSLTNLCVQEARTSKKMLLHLLSNSPLLKSVDITNSIIRDNYPDNELVRDDSSIINLFGHFPVIEKLSISFSLIKCFAEVGLPEELPSTLVHLKYLFIEDISLVHKYGLPSIFLLIRSSPNLEKLKIEILDDSWFDDIYERRDSVTLEDYLDIQLEHLNELEITNMICKKTELDFVKLILAKSPVLKKVTVFLNNEVANDEEFEISIILLSCQRASPSVKIIIEFVKAPELVAPEM